MKILGNDVVSTEEFQDHKVKTAVTGKLELQKLHDRVDKLQTYLLVYGVCSLAAIAALFFR